MIRALIIDDELNARNIIKSFITKYTSEIDVIGEADGVISGLELIKLSRPDLIFLDVRMGDGTAFDLLGQLIDRSFDLVFVTAYDEYAIKAIKHSAIDYLLKPLHPDEFMETIEKIKIRKNENKNDLNRYEKLLQNFVKEESIRIVVPDLKGITFIESCDILWCQSVNKYTIIKLNSGDEIVSTKSLKELEESLINQQFCRIHNAHLINLKYVLRYIRGEGGTVVMKNGTQIEVSRRKKAELMEKMKISN